MSAEDELLRAQAYRASLERRARAQRARLGSLRGDPAARRALDQKFQPLKGPNDDGKRVTGGTT